MVSGITENEALYLYLSSQSIVTTVNIKFINNSTAIVMLWRQYRSPLNDDAVFGSVSLPLHFPSTFFQDD